MPTAVVGAPGAPAGVTILFCYYWLCEWTYLRLSEKSVYWEDFCDVNPPTILLLLVVFATKFLTS